MKLISLNIEINKHHDKVLPFLKMEQPDVICIQELAETDFDFYKKELQMQGVYQPFSYIESPNHLAMKGYKYGVAIFAKNIINSGYIFYFGSEHNISKSYQDFLSDEDNSKNSVLVWADVKDAEGRLFKVSTTHLPVTEKGESSPYQLEVVDAMLAVLRTIPEFIICGDMNAPRGNETFRRLAEKYKDNIPLEYKTSIDVNLHRAGKTHRDELLDKMVDCLFTTPQYRAANVRLVDGVSDHMAIVADIEKKA